MRFFVVLFLTSCFTSAMAGDPRIYYIHLMPEVVQGQLKIQYEPMLFTNTGKPTKDIFLSEVIQDAVIHLRDFENKGDGRPVAVFRFPIFLQVRPLDGSKPQLIKSHFDLGLGNPGFLRVKVKDWHTDFGFNEMGNAGFYPQVFRAIMQAVEGDHLDVPSTERFAVELFYSFPKVLYRFVGQNFPHRYANVWEKSRVKSLKKDNMNILASLQLGVSWCANTSAGLQAVNLGHRLNFEQTKHLLQASRSAGMKKDMVTALKKLEAYFERVPSSKKVAHVIADLHLAQNPQKALSFMKDYQPYFAHFFQMEVHDDPGISGMAVIPEGRYVRENTGRTNQHRSLVMRANNRRKKAYKKLIKALPQSQSSKTHRAWIASPVPGDLVAGEILVEAVAWAADETVSMLQADCLVGGRVLDSISSLPLRFRVKVPDGNNQEIRVRIYFDDGTYTEGAVKVQGQPVDEETRVPASRLQVVGARNGKALQLNETNLSVFEDGEKIRPNLVKQDQQPVDLAILIDTSTTMAHRLPQAQFAVHNLLKNLRDGETASIYTFDEKVALLARYDGNMDEVEPILFTLSGYGTTSLNDALVVARSQLLAKTRATRAIIVIGDGSDTSSITTNQAAISMLTGAPMRVYTVDMGMGDKSLPLERIANAAGGTYTHVDNWRHFGDDLVEILDELRSLYFVTYQGLAEHPKAVRTESNGKKLRSVRVTL